VNGANGGKVDGVVTAGLVIGTVGGEEFKGVGSGYMTGTGGAVEGGVSMIGVGKGFKEGMVMVGFVEGTVMMVGVGLVEGTVVMGLVTWPEFKSSWTTLCLPAQHNDCTLVHSVESAKYHSWTPSIKGLNW
jgi:hypothetical protein